MSLHKQKCVPCEGGEPKISIKDAIVLNKAIPKWKIVNKHHLVREYKFKDFKEAFDFVAQIKDIAESMEHHPDIALGYGYVNITIFTHAINDLHENDFILAGKISAII